ncbi:MAG: glycerophosphodiester phosphodiesterase [Alkalispirochaeta sp.]
MIQDIRQALAGARDAGTPIVFGHRGCAAVALENTLDAFARARADGVPGVELDVQLARDGTIVVHHDRDLRRLGGQEVPIAEVSAQELAALPLSDGKRGLSATGVPTLEAVIETLGPEIYVDIEIKSYADIPVSIADALVALLLRLGIANRVFISSFDPRRIRDFHRAWHREVLPAGGTEPPCAAIYADVEEVPWMLRRGAGMILGGCSIRKPSWRDIVSTDGEESHGVSRPLRGTVIPWTVNDGAVARTLRNAGVAGLIGDDPVMLREALEEPRSG